MSDTELMSKLARIEQSIRASDGAGILARWDFGRAVLEQRVGAFLPKGLNPEICRQTGISAEELSRRTRLAEHYSREELSHLCETSNPTWSSLVNTIPRKKQTNPRPKSSTSSNTGPTKATLAEADRVQALIVKPDVAAEIARRADEDKAARKALILIERQEREEAKVQRERDLEAQRQADVLRMRLVRGDTDWVNITEQYETMSDTVKRHLGLLDGLPNPEELQRKILGRHLRDLQGALFELTGRLFPSYEQPVEEIWRGSVIDVTS